MALPAPDAALPWWEFAARMWEPRQRRHATPGTLAAALDPGTRTSPALDAIDAALAGLPAGEAQGIYMPPQEGKGLALDTPVLTPHGWRAMGSLAAGDTVFGGDGKPCQVTAAHEPRRLDCWRVTLHSGSELVADGDHLWRVQDRHRDLPGARAAGQRAHPWVVVNTRVLAAAPRRYGVPLPGPLDMPDADLPLPPYVLGCWLGDGSSRVAGITIGDPELAEHIRAEGVPCRPGAGRYWYSLAAPGAGSRCRPSPVRLALTSLGVWGNKHIPAAYLLASEKQRLALLQGLMDTDGSVYANESGYTRCEYTSTRQVLADGVLTLTRSLGIHSRMHESRATLYGRDVSARWRIRFTTSLPVFRLSRKAARLDGSPGPRKPRHRNGVIAVEPVASVPTRCIEVDSPDRTYLAGAGLTPTHNSERVSRRYPEWLHDDDPTLRIGIVSYELDKAVRWGRAIKHDVAAHGCPQGQGCDDPGCRRLHIEIRKDSSAAGRWGTVQGGGLYCVGIGGPLTGEPIDVLIVDDPVKDRAAAESKVIREATWDWWESVALPRLAPGARVAMVQTRWHQDDLAGRIAVRPSPLPWRVLTIPAIATAGDPLGRAPGEELASVRGREPGYFHRMRAGLSNYVFASIYQQKPTAAEGNFFRRATFRYWRQADAWADGRERVNCEGTLVTLTDCWRFATMDVAASTRTGADYTVVSAWAVTPSGDLILLDRRRAQVAQHDHFGLFAPLRTRWGLDMLWVEKGFFASTVVKDAQAAGVPVAPLDPDTDKVTRATPAAARVHAGKVWFPAEATGCECGACQHGVWLDEWCDELATFPRATHDDQVDTLAYAAWVITWKWAPQPPAGQPETSTAEAAIAAAHTAATGNGHGDLDLLNLPY